jgi:natural product precursor
MKKIAKIRLKNVSDVLTESELKHVFGGDLIASSCETRCDPTDCPTSKPKCIQLNGLNGYYCTCFNHYV